MPSPGALEGGNGKGRQSQEPYEGPHLFIAHLLMYSNSRRAIILVIDSTDRERLPIAKAELLKMANDENLAGAALLVLANKQDVRGCVGRPAFSVGCLHAWTDRACLFLPIRHISSCMNAAQISEGLDLTSLRDRQWHIVACSALTGKGLEEGLDWLTLRLSGK